MIHFKLTLQYDGTNYSGWQRQKREVTIQGKIEECLRRIFKKEVTIRGAGRTDAGVHALSQIATFRIDVEIAEDALKKALNSMLPRDIRVLRVDRVDDAFHPQYDVKRKSYIYFLSHGEEASSFLQRYVWFYERRLDLSVMKKAGRLFLGRHDFSAFSGSTEVKNRQRTIYQLEIKKVRSLAFLDLKISGNFIKFRIEADGFLKYMVRNIVGSIVEVGRGAVSLSAIAEALKTGKRPNPLRTAPPQGLFLERIIY